MELNRDAYNTCTLCPRRCGAQRTQGRRGVCGADATPKVARAALHFWEEPPVSGEAGSGAIFFSGCPLRCVFCQNHQISHEGAGIEVDAERIARMMLNLQEQGALNINLVTALHFAPDVVEAARMARDAGLRIPLLCNTSGYELPQVVDALADVIDVWLTDYKYASRELAGRLSGAPDYPDVAHEALAHMLAALRRRGGRMVDDDGIMRQGIIVRHLVLPDCVEDSCAVLDRVWDLCGNEVDLSVMNQYTPNERCRRHEGPLARGLDEDEYEIVLCHADDLGFDHLWWQQGGTVDESFVPAFDATGVLE